MFRSIRSFIRPAALIVGVGILTAAASARQVSIYPSQTLPSAKVHNLATMTNRTTQFAGAKANAGYVTFESRDGKRLLTLSDDFKVPETPAPHWQVVDSSGNTYLLQRLVVKGDKLNKTIEIPSYVSDVSKVQIWCAYAEVNLGEAAFATPVK